MYRLIEVLVAVLSDPKEELAHLAGLSPRPPNPCLPVLPDLLDVGLGVLDRSVHAIVFVHLWPPVAKWPGQRGASARPQSSPSRVQSHDRLMVSVPRAA